MTATERFLQYVTIDTQSKPDCETVPSTQKQHNLAKLLTEELHEMGAKNVVYDTEHCYVYATISGIRRLREGRAAWPNRTHGYFRRGFRRECKAAYY